MVVPSFTWIPSWQTQEQSEPRTRLADLASAISVGSDGSNTDLKSWNVVLENRLHDEALAIDFFLASRGGVEPFEWSNPRSLSKLYVCEQWDSVVNAKAAGSDPVANRIWTITASFREAGEAGLGGTVRPPGGAVSPVYDYSAFGNIPIRVFWISNAYRRRFSCSTGELILDAPSANSGTLDTTTSTVWAATQDSNYPVPVPDFQPFPPVGYFSPILNWNLPCGIPSFLMSQNGSILKRDAGANTTVANSLYGNNISSNSDSRWEVGQTLAITKIELRGNVAGLGAIGDDITAQGLVFLPLGAGGLPASQTFIGPANATP